MIQLEPSIPAESGFYFLNYYFHSNNEVLLDKLTLNLKNELISHKDKENVSIYEDSAFSTKLPDYITQKFVKIVNDIIVCNSYDVHIDFAVNNNIGFDETFTVFINTGNELYIITQHISGKVDSTMLYGQDSISKLLAIVS